MGRIFQLLILIGLAAIVWMMVRKALAPPPTAASREPQAFEPMARCAACGTHVPREQLDAAGVCARCRSAP